MSLEVSPRSVRFSHGEEGHLLDLKTPLVMERPHVQTSDSGGSGSSGDDQLTEIRTPASSVNLSPLDARPQMNSLNSSIRSHRGSNDSNGTYGRLDTMYSSTPALNGGTPRPQRPIGPARTPSSTYNPPRRPPQPPFISIADRNRSGSASRYRQDPNASYRAQEKGYIQRLRQDQPGEYFEPYTPSVGYGTGSDTEADDESPSEPHFDNDAYDQETLLFYGNDDIAPTTEYLKDPENR
jgi:mitogen-activated protein kinase kinase kinase